MLEAAAINLRVLSAGFFSKVNVFYYFWASSRGMFQAFLRIVLGEKSSLSPGPLALLTGSLDVDDDVTVHFAGSGPLPLLPHIIRKRWRNFLRLKASSSSPLYWIVPYPMPKRFITSK